MQRLAPAAPATPIGLRAAAQTDTPAAIAVRSDILAADAPSAADARGGGELLELVRERTGATRARIFVGARGVIFESRIAPDGRKLETRLVGSVLSLPVVSSVTTPDGYVFRRHRDISGREIVCELAPSGTLLAARLVPLTPP